MCVCVSSSSGVCTVEVVGGAAQHKPHTPMLRQSDVRRRTTTSRLTAHFTPAPLSTAWAAAIRLQLTLSPSHSYLQPRTRHVASRSETYANAGRWPASFNGTAAPADDHIPQRHDTGRQQHPRHVSAHTSHTTAPHKHCATPTAPHLSCLHLSTHSLLPRLVVLCTWCVVGTCTTSAT